jgi:thioredoxin reductase (NADPH)
MKKSKVIIIGSGAAGYTAAIYAARANLQPILFQGFQPGGQLTITTDVDNYPGFENGTQGPELMNQMEKQAKNVGTQIINDHIKKVNFKQKPFKLQGESGEEYVSDAVIIATGASAKWLGLDSEKKFQGFGVSGCATCDGFFFKNQNVAVVGGGNTAAEEALFLTNFAKKVYLIHRRDTMRAEKILQQKLLNHPKIETVWNSQLVEIIGNEDPKAVTAIKIKNLISEEISQLGMDGVFIAIGHKPNTGIFSDSDLNLDEEGYIVTQKGSAKTNISGVFAAGDVQDKIYRQAITAAGTGCMAALEAEKFLG